MSKGTVTISPASFRGAVSVDASSEYYPVHFHGLCTAARGRGRFIRHGDIRWSGHVRVS